MQKTIVTAWAEQASGFGWSNTPIWYIKRDGQHKLTLHCLQPKKQTRDMQVLYRTSEAAHIAMRLAVLAKLRERKMRVCEK